jgi:hypothetical protein
MKSAKKTDFQDQVLELLAAAESIALKSFKEAYPEDELVADFKSLLDSTKTDKQRQKVAELYYATMVDVASGVKQIIALLQKEIKALDSFEEGEDEDKEYTGQEMKQAIRPLLVKIVNIINRTEEDGRGVGGFEGVFKAVGEGGDVKEYLIKLEELAVDEDDEEDGDETVETSKEFWKKRVAEARKEIKETGAKIRLVREFKSGKGDIVSQGTVGVDGRELVLQIRLVDNSFLADAFYKGKEVLPQILVNFSEKEFNEIKDTVTAAYVSGWLVETQVLRFIKA